MNKNEYIVKMIDKASLNYDQALELNKLLDMQNNADWILDRINDLVMGYGVEFIRPKLDWIEENLIKWGVDYINEGDSHTPTAYFWRGRWWFGCIADHLAKVSFGVYA